MSKELNEIINDLTKKRLSRRDFIVKASALGLSMGAIGSLLAACGGGTATPAATATGTAAATETATAAATSTATAAATATASASATATQASSASPKVLRIRLYGDIQNMDPAFYISENDTDVAFCVNQGLVTYGANSYDIVNDLAESIDTSADGLTITFKLKPGMKWHNGFGNVTADDVKFSYERIADPALKSPYKDDWATLDHVEVIDDLNGKIILKEAFAPLFKSTLPVGSGLVLCKKYIEQVGNEKYATQILGSGPYMFDSWTPKQQLVVKKNPDWTGQPVDWDEIHFIPIEDDKAAEVALEAGEIDFTRISVTSVERYKSGGQYGVWEKPALRFRWIGMNTENPKLKDIRVRQAIRYAIDVPSILQAAYQGQYERENAIIAPGLLGYWKDAPVYQRDAEKAKSLLQEAGVTSLDLSFKCQDAQEFKTWGQVAQANLAEVGINLSVVPMDSASFWVIGTADQSPELELFEGSYSMEPDPSWATVWFICDQINVWNWMRWCSTEYDTLHKQALTELDDTKREQMYIKMQQLWDEACISVWISNGKMVYGYAKNLQPATTPHGLMQPTFFKSA